MNQFAQVSPIENALVGGDLSRLNADERLSYVTKICDSLGLNYLTRPFEYITLNGKLTLYAKRDATDQLRKLHKISINIVNRENVSDVYIVTAKAKNADGREDESTGAVNIVGLKGDNLANALMKAETKAKRRVTLSICGLGFLDESEIETVAESKPAPTPVKNPLKEIREAKELVEEDPGEYVITFGKYKTQKIKDVDMFDLNNYVKFIHEESEKSAKPIKGQVADFMTAATLYLSLREVRSQAPNWGDESFDNDPRGAK